MTVVASEEFAAWFRALADADRKAVDGAIGKLRALGLDLPYPHSSAIEGASIAMRELRPKAGASPLRVFYAFDPKRQAVLLLGGSKNDRGLYTTKVKEAEAVFARYLEEIEP